MHAVITKDRIDIYRANEFPNNKWESLLKELKAEHVPTAMPQGKIMQVVSDGGGMTAFIYRTNDLRDDEIVKILQKYGISTR
jgi:hypothetical protein